MVLIRKIHKQTSEEMEKKNNHFPLDFSCVVEAKKNSSKIVPFHYTS